MNTKTKICGFGAADADLTGAEMFSIVADALAEIPANSRVLAIIPDKTRDDNTDVLFPFANEILRKKSVAKFDALVAQGTHAPMTEAEKFAKVGFDNSKHSAFAGEIFDHQWNNAEALNVIGEISAREIAKISDGLVETAVSLTINKLISITFYDFILIFGGVVPHEVAGFAGGAKYFFPGVSGAELTNTTHWIGALAGIENIIGRVETPTRILIETAADFVEPKTISFSSVMTRDAENKLITHALFAGDFRLSFRRAAEISRQKHIKYTGRKYRRVLAFLDEHYDELWTGGKASYKLGAIIENGGELVIYAPHLRGVSETHGAAIEKFGYAPIEKVKQLVGENSDLRENLCVAAHLAHVAYGVDEKNPFAPRYRISLASQIDAETCGRLNLAYADYRNFELENYENDAETLIVERAGRDLYLP